jgi:hypothetical protein
MTLIGVTGHAQHGKDTVGKRLVEQWGYQKFAFADRLKSMALVLNPVIANLPFLRLADIVERDGWEEAKRWTEVRRFLQVLGTEGVREHLGEDAWVNALDLAIARAGDPTNVVITDVRFPNEAKYIHEMNGTLIRVVRRNEDGSPFINGVMDHPSERYVDRLPADFVINALSGDFVHVNTAVDIIAGKVAGHGVITSDLTDHILRGD